MGHVSDNISNNDDHNLFTFMLKVYYMFIAMFEYKQYDTSNNQLVFRSSFPITIEMCNEIRLLNKSSIS